MKKTLFVSVLVLIMMVLALAPLFAGGQAEGAKGKKVYFSSGEGSPTQVALFNDLEKEYEAAHPDIDIIYERLVTESGSLFIASMAAGVPKGVFSLGNEEVLTFASKDVYIPLNDVIDEIGRDDFQPWAILSVEGKDLGTLYSGSMRVMLYRTDLYSKAGLEVPKTHPELIDTVRKLTVDENGDGVTDIYGIGIPGGTGHATHFYAIQFLWQNGAEIFDKNFNPVITKPAAIEAIETYAELLKIGPPGASTWSWSEHREAYSSGLLATSIMGGRQPAKIGMDIPDIAKVTMMAPLPYNKIRTSTGGGDAYVIAKTSPNVEETKDFLKWLLTGDRSMRFLTSVPGHLIPPRKSQAKEMLDYVSDDPAIAKYMKDYRHWLDVILNEVAPYSIDYIGQIGSIQGDKFVPTFQHLPPELAARLYGEPGLFSEVIYKVAWEGWAAKDAAAWCAEEIRKILKEMGKL